MRRQRLSLARQSRFRGALLGAAVGDALGWPQEPNNNRVGRGLFNGGFADWKRKTGGRFWAVEEVIEPGSYSDDTQLILATHRALKQRESWFEAFALGELPAWLLYERGGGGATKRAASLWSKGIPPWEVRDAKALAQYFAAGGNGAAMRILWHAAVCASDVGELRASVVKNAMITHGHPRGILGALVNAIALMHASQKDGTWYLGELAHVVLADFHLWVDPPDLGEVIPGWDRVARRFWRGPDGWRQAVSEIERGLQSILKGIDYGALSDDYEVLRELGASESSTFGSGTASVLAAIYLASRYAADPATGLRVAASAKKTDTDTVASMTGALLGAMLGDSWLPPAWQRVQDARYLESLVIVGGPDREQPAPARWTANDSKRVRHELREGASQIEIGPVGTARVLRSEPLRPLGSARTVRWHLETKEGQTLFIYHSEREQRDQVPAGRMSSTKDQQTSLALITASDGLESLQALVAMVRVFVTEKKRLPSDAQIQDMWRERNGVELAPAVLLRLTRLLADIERL